MVRQNLDIKQGTRFIISRYPYDIIKPSKDSLEIEVSNPFGPDFLGKLVPSLHKNKEFKNKENKVYRKLERNEINQATASFMFYRDLPMFVPSAMEKYTLPDINFFDIDSVPRGDSIFLGHLAFKTYFDEQGLVYVDNEECLRVGVITSTKKQRDKFSHLDDLESYLSKQLNGGSFFVKSTEFTSKVNFVNPVFQFKENDNVYFKGRQLISEVHFPSNQIYDVPILYHVKLEDRIFGVGKFLTSENGEYFFRNLLIETKEIFEHSFCESAEIYKEHKLNIVAKRTDL